MDREELWWSAHGEQGLIGEELGVKCECERERNGGRGGY
jgi:hypothetical protein